MTQQTGPESAEPRAGNLTGPARQVHQAALAEFARTGQPPVRSKLERLARSLGASPDAVLAELAEADAIVFNDHGEIRAAYPFSPSPPRSASAGPAAPPPTQCARSTRSACPPCSGTRSPSPPPSRTQVVSSRLTLTAAARAGGRGAQSCSSVPQVIPAVPQRTAPAGTSTSSPAAGPRGPGQAATRRSPGDCSPRRARSASASPSSATCCSRYAPTNHCAASV